MLHAARAVQGGGRRGGRREGEGTLGSPDLQIFPTITEVDFSLRIVSCANTPRDDNTYLALSQLSYRRCCYK